MLSMCQKTSSISIFPEVGLEFWGHVRSVGLTYLGTPIRHLLLVQEAMGPPCPLLYHVINAALQ
jgi:hypothetical protein